MPGFDLTYSPTQNNDQQKQIQAFKQFVNDEVDAIIPVLHRGFRLG